MRQQLKNLWEQLEWRQRVVLIALGAATLVCLVLLAFWSSRPAYGVLFADMHPEDAAAVVEQLRQSKTPYRLTNGGTTVEVPQAEVYNQRLKLASEGLPRGGVVGFEVFDRSGLPGTEFSNSVSFQRALQGELTRTIESLDAVQWARVHLVLPRPSLFTEREEKPTASVVLGLSGAADLSRQQIRGLRHLVASAVDRLSAEGVTVVDSHGDLLAAPDEDGTLGQPGALTMAQLEAQRGFEDRLRSRLQTMLDDTLGVGHAIVRVRAELEFDTTEVTDETISSGPGGQGLVAREQTSEETYEGAGRGTAGAPGVASNLRGSAGSPVGTGPGKYSSTEKIVEYDHSKRTESTRRAPGKVQRLTVAAAIDEEAAGGDTRRIEELLAAAAGIDESRGDLVVVRPMKIEALAQASEAAKAEEEAARRAQRQRQVMALIRHGALVLLGLLMLIFAGRAARQKSMIAGPLVSIPEEAEEEPRVEEEPELPPAAPSEEPAQLEPALEGEPAGAVGAMGGPSSGARIQDEIMDLAASDAELVARAVRRLVHGS